MNNSEVVRSVSESLQRLGELAPRYNEELVAAAETVSRVETFLARVGIDLFTEVSLHEDGGGCQVWDGDTELEEVTTLSVAFVHGTPRICVNLKFYQLATFEVDGEHVEGWKTYDDSPHPEDACPPVRVETRPWGECCRSAKLSTFEHLPRLLEHAVRDVETVVDWDQDLRATAPAAHGGAALDFPEARAA
jgi:hypothetical protein